YFAVRVLITSISGLVNPDASTDFLNLLLFGMLLSLGLSNVVQLIEMIVNRQKKHAVFTLLLISTIFVLGVSAYML
ncbi:hypothetical protein, partial [Radiobacillus sp. PE A8.2]|uniref:hypothetical protein n=1 Tax=Radiobacillus sp. PE A8.2 TaxID=3380349 RepID=UPI00388F5089